MGRKWNIAFLAGNLILSRPSMCALSLSLSVVIVHYSIALARSLDLFVSAAIL